MLLHLRNLLGSAAARSAAADPGVPRARLRRASPTGPLPEIEPADADARAAARRDPQRRLPARPRPGRPPLAPRASPGEIDRSFTRARALRGRQAVQRRYYVPFEHDPRRGLIPPRNFIEAGGGVLAVDSPQLSFELGELLLAAGIARARRGLPARAPAGRGRQDDAAQGRAQGQRRLAPGRQVHGRGQGAQPVAVAVGCGETRPASTSCRGASSSTWTPRPTRR